MRGVSTATVYKKKAINLAHRKMLHCVEASENSHRTLAQGKLYGSFV